MWSPSRTKKLQSLTKRVAALNRFISKATDKCLPFLDSLKGNKSFCGMTRASKHLERSKNTWASRYYFQSLLMVNRSSFT